jgi:subtilisin family serine protease
MKKILLIILIPIALLTQPKFDSRTASILNKFQSKKIGKNNLLNSRGLISVFAVLNEDAIQNHNLSDKFTVGKQYEKFISFYVSEDNIASLINNQHLESFSISENYNDAPYVAGASDDAKVNLVHDGFAMPTPFTGKGVIVAIIDGGFDYTHPNFYDTTLQNYRVLAAWDQRSDSGNPPDGYTFGSAYIGEEELLEAKRDTEEIQEHWGTHGTHVGGIAGGSGGGTPLKGVAPDSELIFVTKTDGDAELFEAFTWLSEFAKKEEKRLVINMSFGGLHHGTRDGTNPLGDLMTLLRDEEGVIFVGSAGNNGGNSFHLMRDFGSDTLQTWIRQNSPSNWGNRVVAIGEIGKPFSVNLKIRDKQDVMIELSETGFYSTDNERIELDTFHVVAEDTLYYKMIFEKENPYSKRPRIDLFVKYFSAHRVFLEVTAKSGIVHLWNVLQSDIDRTTNRGGNFSGFGTFDQFEIGDDDYGVGEPGLNDAVITVAAHNHVSKNLTSFSSIGPRIDGTIKPDISAPGQQVLSSLASFINDREVTTSTTFNNTRYQFGPLSGTSMSAPMVAGICALILEAKPDITGEELKAVIKATANEDNFTGDLPEGGSVEWGAGKIDAFSAILEVLGIINNAEIIKEENLILYPNPSNDFIKLIGLDRNTPYNIYNLQGNQIINGIYNGKIDISNLPIGNYYISIGNRESTIQFIKK